MWQMECCGDPFEIGATVRWPVQRVTDTEWMRTILGDEWASRVEWQHEPHSDDDEIDGYLEGAVTAIKKLWFEYVTGDLSSSTLAAGSGELYDVPRVSAGEADDPYGWLVEIDTVDPGPLPTTPAPTGVTGG
jgi:hypothetical protein